MNVKTIKPPKKRFNKAYLLSIGIQSYGDDNLYPNKISQVVASSATASGCLARYADFIEGNGFLSQQISDYVVNSHGETLDDVLCLLASDLARFGGFAIHVNYDVMGRVRNMHHVPFITSRLEEPNDEGNVGHIFVHPDWSGEATKSGKKIQVNKQEVDAVCAFDPDSAVGEIEMVGINYYKGQILWYSRSGSMIYPLPIYDCVVADMSTDEGLSNIRYRNARNNFLSSGALITRKGATIIEEEPSRGLPKNDESEYSEVLQVLQGDENACKILEMQLEPGDEEPKFISFSGQNYDKEYSVTTDSVTDNIYSAFNQEAFLSIRRGKLGFSGDVLADAYRYYSGKVTKEQRAISRAFLAIFKHWYEQPFGELTSETFKIQPLLYGTTDNTK